MFQIGFVFCAVVLRCSQGFKTRSRSALRHSLGVSAVITSLLFEYEYGPWQKSPKLAHCKF